MYKRSRRRLWLIAFGGLLVSGCVTETSNAEGFSCHYEWWLWAGAFLAGIVVVPCGWFVRNHPSRTGLTLMILGTLVAFGLAPTLCLERVLVHEQGFEVCSGIWGMTASEKAAFDTLTSSRRAEERTTGRVSRTINVLYFNLKSGSAIRLPLDNDVKIKGAEAIVAQAAHAGIQVVDFR